MASNGAGDGQKNLKKQKVRKNKNRKVKDYSGNDDNLKKKNRKRLGSSEVQGVSGARLARYGL